ncbi:Com family DNA-binding transcriptional regulator [Pararhodospirillum oryzae]|uniref:Com family DNA-binding transcriptional regulator n=1 Tax=Pararhodospirillum oryzae TaxID=478448 RepID=A0A512HBM2_9PROT|nr:hypothetical protein ROR02_29800 [Pararhodospirillum oryzae]
MESIRCGQCGRLLAKAEGVSALEIKCPRCGAYHVLRAASPTPERPRAPSDMDNARCDASQIPGVVGGRQATAGARDLP